MNFWHRFKDTIYVALLAGITYYLLAYLDAIATLFHIIGLV